MEIQRVTEFKEGVLLALNNLIPQLLPSAFPLTKKSLSEIIDSPCPQLFVAIEKESIVGCLTLVIYPIPTSKRAWIEDVIVDEKSRGKGVGKLLVKTALDYAKEREVNDINLTSSPSRAAANMLYQKMGFEQRQTNIYRYNTKISKDS